MVEEIIVYRRRPTEPSSSLKRKPECSTKTDSSQEFHTKISDPILGVQNQVGRAKRIKCIFSPRKDNTSLKPDFSAKETAFESTDSDSSEFSGVVEGNSMRKLRIKTHNDQKKVVAYFDLEALQSELVDVDLNVEVSHRAEKVPFVRLTSESYGKPISGYPLEIGESLQSELVDVNLNVEVSNRAEKVPYPLEIGEVVKSELVDVNLNVELSHQAEKVPLVRLKSELYGKPILGYPLEIGVIVTDGSETVVKKSRMHQLVWRTSRRTPVCYVGTKASGNFEGNGVVSLKKSNLVNGGKTASQTCVPVEVIFSKISSGRAKRIKCIYSPRKKKLPTVFSAKSTECDSSEFSGVVEANSKRKQMTKTRNELEDVNLNFELSRQAEKVPFIRLTSKSYGKPISGYPLEIGEVLQSEELVDVNLNFELGRRAEKAPFIRLTSKSYGKQISGYPLDIGEVLQSEELVDVNLNFELGRRAEKVPFVRLMSELYGKPISGYPLKIGEVLPSEVVDVNLNFELGRRAEKVPFIRLTSKSYGKPISGYPLEIGEVLPSEVVDVNLSFELGRRAEKVPFVRLTSELYGKPILGYPLEIGVIGQHII